MTVSVTLQYASVAAMLADLGRLTPIAAAIAHADRPDVGAPLPPPPAAPVLALVPPAAPPVVDTAAIFGGSTTAVPLAQGLPVMTPPVPEVAAVPLVPTLPAAAAAGPVVDSTGLPWDARIHATNAEKTGGTTNADGTWRKKRGLNDGALIARVEAELRQALGAPAVSPPTAATVQTVAPVVTPPAPPVVVSPPQVPAIPALQTTVATPNADTFAGLMAHLSPKLANPSGGQWLQQALLGAGLTGGVGALATRPDLIPSVRATFDALAAAAT